MGGNDLFQLKLKFEKFFIPFYSVEYRSLVKHQAKWNNEIVSKVGYIPAYYKALEGACESGGKVLCPQGIQTDETAALLGIRGSGGRIGELLRLKARDVNMKSEKHKCLIKKGKSFREVERTIKDVALPYWQEALKDCNNEDVLFSQGLMPSKTVIRSEQNLEVLQADLDQWLTHYNHERPHSGRYCFGNFPMQTFGESLTLAKEKQWDQTNTAA